MSRGICTNCKSKDNYNFVINNGLCDTCIAERLDELEAELNTAKEDKGRLHDALQNLYDEQNGVPLLHHETTWQAAMEEAEKLLKMKL